MTDPYTLERRKADARKFLRHQFDSGNLCKVKPGQVAGTYGGGTPLNKAWVIAEMEKLCELGGDYGK